MRLKLLIVVFLFQETLCIASTPILGENIPPVDVGQFLPNQAVSAIVKVIGTLTTHRPYQGALTQSAQSKDALGLGFGLGIEATLIHLPSDFFSSLETAGIKMGSNSPIASLPIAKVHLTKSTSPVTNFGISGLYYKGSYILGGDFKRVLFVPEEGLVWSFRLSYSETKIDLGAVSVKKLPLIIKDVKIGEASLILNNRSITPEIIGSKKLDFAEPYLGFGLDFLNGQIDLPLSFTVLNDTQTLTTPEYSARAYHLLTGVSFQVPIIGVTWTLEGSFSSIGAHTFGTVIGISL